MPTVEWWEVTDAANKRAFTSFEWGPWKICGSDCFQFMLRSDNLSPWHGGWIDLPQVTIATSAATTRKLG